MPASLNDGSTNAPRLAVYLNLGTLADLPATSSWPCLQGAEAMAALKAAGFEGVQDGDVALARAAGLGSAASGRVDAVGEALELAKRSKDAGHVDATLHVGRGFESDALVGATIDASAKTGDALVFAPEILSPKIYYARMFPGADGTLREESDRYAQALVYARIARECFAEATKR